MWVYIGCVCLRPKINKDVRILTHVQKGPTICPHIVHCVASAVGQGGLLLQTQVSTNEELRARDGGRVLDIGKRLHHHRRHPLEGP